MTTTDDKIDALAGAVSNLTGKVNKLTGKIDSLTGKVDNTGREISDLKDDMQLVRHVQGTQSLQLSSLQSDTRILISGQRQVQKDIVIIKTGYGEQAESVKKLGGLFEDLDHRFQAAGEI